MVTLQIRIRGIVQGVGFRYALLHEARRLGVAGWVRNRADGSVEALLHGDAPAVGALIAWARKGPPAARVQEVEVDSAQPLQHATAAFELLPTV